MAFARQPTDDPRPTLSADDWERLRRLPAATREVVEQSRAAIRRSRERVEASRRTMHAGPCPTCGREAAVLFYPVHPTPTEGPALDCPACCPDVPADS